MRRHRQFLDPGGAGREDRAAGDAGQEPTGVQIADVVAAQHQHHGGQHADQRRRLEQGRPTAAVRDRAADQQGGDEPERVDAEQRL